MIYPGEFYVLLSFSDFETGFSRPTPGKMEDAIREARLEMAREAIGDCPICLEAILDPPIYQVSSRTNLIQSTTGLAETTIRPSAH